MCKCTIMGKSSKILPFPQGFSMFATNSFPSKRIYINAALALAILLSGNLQSQDSAIAVEQSDSRITHKPSQLVSVRVGDDDDEEDEKDRDRKKASKGKQRKKSKQSRYRQESSKHLRRPSDVHPPLPNRPHHEQPNFAPVHSEVLELLGNIHRSLKSIESMMREENERDRKGPEHALQLMNRMRPTFGPQMFGPQSVDPQKPGPQIWNPSPTNPHPPQMNNQPGLEHNQPGHEQANRERANEGIRTPRNFVPPKAGPQNFAPRNAVPPLAGPRNDGPRYDGPRNDGPRNDGPRRDGPRFDG